MTNNTTNITSDVTNTVNDIFLDFISTKMGISFGDALVFWIVMGIIALVIFFILRNFTDFTKSVAFVISIIPIIIVDALVSFGTYTYELPFIGDKTIHNFVMTSSLIDYIFSFQLFNAGKDIMALYVPTEILSTLPIKIITALFSVGDSLLQFAVFSLTIYYIFSLLEYRANREFWWQIPASLFFGAIPVILYAFYFSNPFEEYRKANIEISSVFYFFNTADPIEVTQVLIYAFISFLIVLIAFATISRFVLSATITFVPKMQEFEWKTNYMSIAFLLTLVYSFLYIMHPDYKFYFIIIVIFAWKGFRAAMSALSQNAKRKTQLKRNQDKEINNFITALNNKTSVPSQENHTPKEDNLYLEIVLVGVGAVLLFLAFLLATGHI